jgi:hypothetical protein
MTQRKTIRIITWPDPLMQERIEDVGFFYDQTLQAWIKFCEEQETAALTEWLKRHHLSHEIAAARGRGELKKHARLSDQLIFRNGGSPNLCALCGAKAPCRLWVEGDDTDSTDYPNAARFHLCGTCVQTRMQPHPRLYAPAEEQL